MEKRSDPEGCIPTLMMACYKAPTCGLFKFCWSVRPLHDTVSDWAFPSVVEARRSHNLGSAITLASSHTQLEQSPFHHLKVYVFYSDSALENLSLLCPKYIGETVHY